jgi:predicted transcriptional regulator
MFQSVELRRLDLRYEAYRLRSVHQEKMLLASIAERGIEQPLQGVVEACETAPPVLLDGFKRIRCAKKLGIELIPFVAIGEDLAAGILALLKASNSRSLTLLEQARLVDELKRTHQLSLAEIATRLERSKAWVVVRLDVLSKMSPVARDAVFAGKFPAYSYLYTLRQFRRVNGAKQSDENEFVAAVSGKGLSTRDIECLARGYFQGGSQVREQITQGDLGWCLKELRRDEADISAGVADWTERERGVARDLEIVGRAMGRLTLRLGELMSDGSPGFISEAGLLAGGVSRRLGPFEAVIRRFYDRYRKTPGDSDAPCAGSQPARNLSQAAAEPKYGARGPERSWPDPDSPASGPGFAPRDPS